MNLSWISVNPPATAPADFVVFAVVALLSTVASWSTLRKVEAPAAVRWIPTIFLAGVAVAGWTVVERAGRRAHESIAQRLSTTAPTYAAALEAMGHHRLVTPPSPTDPTYLELVEAQARWLAANNGIADIYTIRALGDGRYGLIVDSETDYDGNGLIEGQREARTAPGEVVELTAAAARALAGTASFRAEPYSDRWGTWITAYHPLRDPDGRVEAVVGIDFPADQWVSAVTKARLAAISFLSLLILVALGGVSLYQRQQHHQLSLRQAEARIAAVCESSPIGLFTTNAAGALQYHNESIRQLAGRPDVSLLGSEFIRVIHPSDRETFRNAWFAAIRESKAIDLVCRATGTEPDPRWLHIRAEPNARSGQAGYVGSVQDVSDARRAQEAVAATATRLRAIFDAAADAIVVIDAEGRIESLNKAAHAMFGYDSDELFGRPIGTILPGIVAADARATLRRSSGGTTESEGRRRDRSVFPVDLAISTMEASGRRSFIALIRDITDRKQAEEDRLRDLSELEFAKSALETTAADLARSMEDSAEARARAEAAARAKSEFLATMSHEIRTPMNGVIGMVGLLLDTPLNAEQRDYALTVKSSAESLLTIINDILDFSKVEAGRLTFEPLPFDIKTTIEETIDLLASKATEKGLVLAARFAPGTPRHLVGDVGRLRQILTNYTGNAIKFTKQGQVLIEVSCEEQGPGDALIRLAVTDSGIGIPEDQIGRLFQKFSQADASTTRKYGGTGLGLAICKQLAELMGGGVGVASVANKGSTFWATVRLPIDRQTIRTPPPADLAGQRLLYVHTDSVQVAWELELAHDLGLVTAATEAAGAVAALDQAHREGTPFDVILIEHGIQSPTAEELAGQLTRRVAIPPRVILITNLGTRGQAATLTSAGFSGYLTRPLRSGALTMALQANANPAAVATTDAPTAVAGAKEGASRVLVVDDNTVNQKVAAKMLERLGWRVDLASNGREAVEMWARVPYHVILMDCQMPEMDGFEATTEIRLREAGKTRVPVVALTANAMQGDRERCLAAGMDDYLTKPIKPDELKAALARWSAGAATLERACP